MTPTTKNWEKEFDGFAFQIGEHHSQDCCSYWESEKLPQIKSFIASLLTAAKQEGRDAAVDHIYRRSAEAAEGLFYVTDVTLESACNAASL